MAAISSTQAIGGLPLSVAGISHHANPRKEMKDLDRRRNQLRALRARGGGRRLHAGASSQRSGGENRSGETEEDLAAVVHALSSLSSSDVPEPIHDNTAAAV